MPGILLDTHALYWLVSGEQGLSEAALIAIGENQKARTLFVSPVTAWELAVATTKSHTGRPRPGDGSPDRWFREAVLATAARVIAIEGRIACEAAKVATVTGHKDPGDCFLIATARIRRVPIVTRDGLIRSIAAERESYFDVIEC